MIPNIFIENWSEHVKWQTPAQIEQDLIISRALIDLYSDPHIKETLVFRGGTALNKLFINPSSRYSEDIDFVQKHAVPIGQTIDDIREVLKPWLGDPKWKITQRSAKLIYKYESINKASAKLKIEINTTEHFQVLPLRTESFAMESEWFTGKANIITYEINELMATKLRALYQRRKGRDLFDLWYVVTNNLVDLNQVFEIFYKYCEYNKIKISGKEFIKNLEQKKDNKDFKSDMNVLLPSKLSWDFDKAYQFVLDNVISRLP
jgi:predicted nucleotidyltransferase component of viral defense system